MSTIMSVAYVAVISKLAPDPADISELHTSLQPHVVQCVCACSICYLNHYSIYYLQKCFIRVILLDIFISLWLGVHANRMQPPNLVAVGAIVTILIIIMIMS